MKKLVSILLLFTTLQGFGQYKYRPAPEKGEKAVILGVLMMGASASGLLGHNTIQSKAIGYVGAGFCVVGVKISIDTDKRRFKVKRKKR